MNYAPATISPIQPVAHNDCGKDEIDPIDVALLPHAENGA